MPRPSLPAPAALTKRATGTARGIAAAVPVALAVAVAGTALHRQAVAVAGVELPWGAAAALLMLGAAQLMLGAGFRSIIPTAAAGLVCYATVGAMSAAGSSKQLVLGDQAGNIWIYGIAGVTVGMLFWCRRYRRGAPAH